MRSDERRGAALASAAGCALLAVHAASYWPFVSDDALISLRYAQNWVRGLGLVWNAGERVEGYSNLAWIALVAGLHRLGVDLLLATRIWAALAGALTVVAVATLPRGGAPGPRLLGVALLASLGPVAVWLVGGLELPLLLALLAWSWWLLGGEPLRSSRLGLAALLLGCAAITRPDGILFAGVAALALLASACGSLRERLAAPALVAGVPLVFLGAQTAFRLGYYGDFVPNSARVKVAFTLDRLADGLAYVGVGVLLAAPLLGLALYFARPAWRAPARRRLVSITLGSALAWSAYVALVGGDIFPGYRQLGPVFLALVFLVTAGAGETLAGEVAPRRVVALSTAGVLALLAFQLVAPGNRRARSERWEYQGQSIATALKRGFAQGPAPLLAASAAGCLPFWSELPALDTLGLNDPYLAKHPPADFGRGKIAHELGDGRYVLSRRPDLMSWCLPRGSLEPCFRSELELARMPEFAAQYVPVRFVGDPPLSVEAWLWVRRRSDSVGVRREASGALFVPAYLFPPEASARAELSAAGVWGVAVAPGTRLALTGLSLPPGRFRLDVVGASAPFEASFGDAFATVPREGVSSGAPLELSLRPRGPARFEGVRLSPSRRGSAAPPR